MGPANHVAVDGNDIAAAAAARAAGNFEAVKKHHEAGRKYSSMLQQVQGEHIVHTIC